VSCLVSLSMIIAFFSFKELRKAPNDLVVIIAFAEFL
jgi:hypothetical protein